MKVLVSLPHHPNAATVESVTQLEQHIDAQLRLFRDQVIRVILWMTVFVIGVAETVIVLPRSLGTWQDVLVGLWLGVPIVRCQWICLVDMGGAQHAATYGWNPFRRVGRERLDKI